MICSRCKGEVDEAFPSRCLEEGCKEVMCDECAVKFNFKCKAHSIKKPKVVLEEVRRSHIELYKKCPRAFELQVVQGKEVASGIYADIGIKLHDIFDIASKEDYIDMHSMNYEYEQFFKKLEPKQFEGCQRKLSISEFMAQQLQKGYRNIEGFKTLCEGMGNPWKSEERISIPIPNTNIKATIAFDRINKNADGSYDLLDYKTGKVHVGKKLNDDLQTPLYIKCVEDNYGIKIKRFIYLFTGECKERIFERISDDRFVCMVGKKEYGFSISEKIEEISKIFRNIEQAEFFIPTELHPYTCENECGSYKNGDCQGKFNGQWKGVS
jgi:hypothetical protein